jgi:hypothetical protein
MSFLYNGLIIGLIFKAIKSIIVAIYKFLKLLNLHVCFFVSVAGGIAYLSGGFKYDYVKYGFYVLFFATLLISIIVTFKGGFKKKNKKAKNVHILNEEKRVEENQNEQTSSVTEEKPFKEEVYPKYYRSAKNSNYIWAEFKDRYELYKIEQGRMRFIRQDKKV